jgi:hypothetical protein
VSLGDCLVCGVYAPPLGALCIREPDMGDLAGPGPLLARPARFEQV